MRCKFVKASGQVCEAKALKGKGCCFFHSKDEEVRDKRIKASSQGGKSKLEFETQGLNSNYFQLKTVSEVLSLLEYAINNLLQGKIAREKASCIGYLANITLGAIKDNSFEQRLEVIENVLEQSKQA